MSGAGGRWPVSVGRCPVWPVAGVRCPVAGGRCPVSGVRCPLSGVRWPVAGGRWPVADGYYKYEYCGLGTCSLVIEPEHYYSLGMDAQWDALVM